MPATRIPLLAKIVRPYIWSELPGWGTVYRLTYLREPDNSDRWSQLPLQMVRGKWHGQLMELDLADWSERFTYFLGRYYDLPTQLLLKEYLHEGDCVADIGANIGMISIYASHLVGRRGRVLAFEPNPLCCWRIESLIRKNRLSNVTLFQTALSSEAGTMELKVNPFHSGTATLSPLSLEDETAYSERIAVKIQRGDTVFEECPPVQLLKIDVEGFEVNVLRGCKKTLQKWMPAVVTEAVSDHLVRAGSSLDELFGFLNDLGYIGYQLTTEHRFMRHHLALKPISDSHPLEGEDIFWLHPRSEIGSRSQIARA